VSRRRPTIASTQKSEQSESLITVQNLEHPRAITRGIKACLRLAGAAAAGVLALTVTSPAAVADTVDLPDVPTFSGETMDSESHDIAPFFGGEAYQVNSTFTDLFGESIDTTASYYDGGPLQVDEYTFPGINPSTVALQVTDPGGGYGIEGRGLDGSVESSTFSAIRRHAISCL
jgi:hypothetical protein